MSRTYRKRIFGFESYYRDVLDNDTFNKYYKRMYGKKWRDRLKAQYNGRTSKGFDYKLPKAFRKSVNRQRRRKDTQKTHLTKYVEPDTILFDPWNCKTSNSWGYW